MTQAKLDRLQHLIRMNSMLQQQMSKLAREIANNEASIKELRKELEEEKESEE